MQYYCLQGQNVLNTTLSKSLQRKSSLSDASLTSVTANTTQFLNSIQVAHCSWTLAYSEVFWHWRTGCQSALVHIWLPDLAMFLGVRTLADLAWESVSVSSFGQVSTHCIDPNLADSGRALITHLATVRQPVVPDWSQAILAKWIPTNHLTYILSCPGILFSPLMNKWYSVPLMCKFIFELYFLFKIRQQALQVKHL